MRDFWTRALTPSAGNRSAALLLGGSASTGSALGAYNLSFAERIVDTVNRAMPSSRRLTLTNVAQGSTRTLWALSLFESLWARSTSPDLIIWEYGINDVYLCSERPEEEVEARTKLPGGLSWDETLACTLEVFLRRLSLLPSPPAVLLVFLWPCSLKPHMRRRRYFSVAAPVQRAGYSCIAIHGDMTQAARTDALDQFKSVRTPLLIATDVAARGLDIPDVEVVINYTFPLTIEDYIHRI
eukprot:jgi/Chrpa1/3571/Chrysochromulina_OHIO_Genome00016866-RA